MKLYLTDLGPDWKLKKRILVEVDITASWEDICFGSGHNVKEALTKLKREIREYLTLLEGRTCTKTEKKDIKRFTKASDGALDERRK